METRKAEKAKRSRRAGNSKCNHGRKAQQGETKIEGCTYKNASAEERGEQPEPIEKPPRAART